MNPSSDGVGAKPHSDSIDCFIKSGTSVPVKGKRELESGIVEQVGDRNSDKGEAVPLDRLQLASQQPPSHLKDCLRVGGGFGHSE